MSPPIAPPRATGSVLLRLYPASWRARYADEVREILADRPPDVRARLDLIRGAWDAHVQASAVSRRPAIAAFVAGAAWTIAGASTVVQPAPPDWPGFTSSTLAIGLIGVAGALGFVQAIVAAIGDKGARPAVVAISLFVLGHGALAATLLVALIGGPYGAVTGAALASAAIGSVAVGLVAIRVGTVVAGLTLVVAGGALAIPSPASWIVVGGAWTALATWWAVVRPELGSPGPDLRGPRLV